ncbi:hypothetical protein HPB49_006404 [Dermacentor silvarum]|uniref:Uncharacterized protein n=1 Tax=Dermacentor silvarum TaxID=543639 RepID=A0ACB8DW06_DERSI|nr:hypothetical protein HPB49_006404 [Dermacentor silvarum]
MAAPDNALRSIIYNAVDSQTQDEIAQDLQFMNVNTPYAIADARQIGRSQSILITFIGTTTLPRAILRFDPNSMSSPPATSKPQPPPPAPPTGPIHKTSRPSHRCSASRDARSDSRHRSVSFPPLPRSEAWKSQPHTSDPQTAALKATIAAQQLQIQELSRQLQAALARLYPPSQTPPQPAPAEEPMNTAPSAASSRASSPTRHPPHKRRSPSSDDVAPERDIVCKTACFLEAFEQRVMVRFVRLEERSASVDNLVATIKSHLTALDTRVAVLEARQSATEAILMHLSLPAPLTPAPTPTPRLLHLWEAYHAIHRQWQAQKHNRCLHLRLARLASDMEEYCSSLLRQQWGQTCDRMAGNQASQRKYIFHLLHSSPLTDTDFLAALRDRYLCTDPPTTLPAYTELTEAHRTAQLLRLSRTRPGYALLSTLKLSPLPTSLPIASHFSTTTKARPASKLAPTAEREGCTAAYSSEQGARDKGRPASGGRRAYSCRHLSGLAPMRHTGYSAALGTNRGQQAETARRRGLVGTCSARLEERGWRLPLACPAPEDTNLIQVGPFLANLERFSFRPRVADAEPNGYVGARVRTDRSCKMTNLSAQRGSDPDAMAWATIPVPEGQQSAAADPIRNEELFRMVERRSQRKAMKMDPSAPPAGKAPSTQTGSATRAAQGSGAKRSKPTTTWKPKPLPRPHPEDFVIIIKPPLGAAFATFVGVQKAATLNLLLSPEQNLIIASTREAQTADQLLSDFELQTDKGKMAAHGHLKQHGEDVCYGVVMVANHETTDTLRQALQWHAGELLDIRKFGTSNKARLTFAGRVKPRYIHYNSEITFVQPYYWTIPACGLCGTVGHRADSCPNPANAKCGLCGQQAELVEGVRTPHECNPKCAVCGGSHATNSRECTAKYRQPKMTTPQQSGLPKSGKKTRHHAAFSHGGSRYVDVTTQQAPPCGGDVKGQAAQQQPPHDGKGNRGQQQQQRKDAGAGAWANAVKYGKQPHLSNPPPPSPTLIAKEIHKHTEPLRAKIASLEAQLSNPPSAPTSPSASNAESLDNARENYELITSKVNQAVAAQLRTLHKAGPLRDVSGRPSKFSCRIVDIDDDEDCTLAGLDAKTLLHSLLTPNLTMAGTPKFRRSAPYKSASPTIITQWNCRGLRSRTKEQTFDFSSQPSSICPRWLPSKSQGRAPPLRTIRRSSRTPRLVSAFIEITQLTRSILTSKPTIPT